MDTNEEKDQLPEDEGWKLACIRCHATKYCPDCTIGYKEKDNFCSKCGKPLETLEAFEKKDCPICSKSRMSGVCFVLKSRTFAMPAMSEKDWLKARLPKGGLKFTNYCDCGRYRPCSTHGVIDYSCAHCGGKPRPVTCR